MSNLQDDMTLLVVRHPTATGADFQEAAETVLLGYFTDCHALTPAEIKAHAGAHFRTEMEKLCPGFA